MKVLRLLLFVAVVLALALVLRDLDIMLYSKY